MIMTPLAYVPDDGYTLSGFVNEVPFLHPRLRFSWRPMSTSEVALYAQRAERLDAPRTRQLGVATLAGKLVSWDLVDRKGQPVPLVVETLGRLNDRLFQRLFGIVFGQQPPDGLEGQEKEDADSDFQAVLEAAAKGQAPGPVQESQDRKNS